MRSWLGRGGSSKIASTRTYCGRRRKRAMHFGTFGTIGPFIVLARANPREHRGTSIRRPALPNESLLQAHARTCCCGPKRARRFLRLRAEAGQACSEMNSNCTSVGTAAIDALSAQIVPFSGGSNLSRGCYKIVYITGAHRHTPTDYSTDTYFYSDG